jgi:hypothetical protein
MSVSHQSDVSPLFAAHNHFKSSALFCSCKFVIPRPSKHFGRVTHSHDTRQCPFEYFSALSCHRNLLLILFNVWRTHMGNMNAYMKCSGIALSMVFVRTALPAGERCFTANSSYLC